VSRVAVAAQRRRLDRLRPLAGASPLDRVADRLVGQERVGAVDARAGQRPAPAHALRHARVQHLARRRGRVGVLVVLEDEDRRHPQDAGEVQALVDVADAERALAEEGERHARLPPALEGERGTDADGHEVAEHRHEREDVHLRLAEVHVAVAPPGRARAPAEEVAEHVGDRDAAGVVRRLLAVERQHDVVGAEREPRSRRDPFLSAAGVHRPRDPPLSVERHDPILGEPLQQHQVEQAQPYLARDARGIGGRRGEGLDAGLRGHR
jgi:hypothetical protein